MVVDPGGPGASGLSLNVELVDDLLSEGLGSAAGEYDWIGFDPRGVGASRPALSCLPGYFRADRPSYVPRTPRLLAYWRSASRRYARACEAKGPLQVALLRHMTTPDLARDMDQIRTALGQRQISYYGFSYGTYLGQVYATMFPGNVAQLVLDSNVNPTRVPYHTFNLDQDIPFNRNENLWFKWLAKFNPVYHLGKTGRAVRSLFYATETRLGRDPAGGIVGPDEWVDEFQQAGYYEETWVELGQVLSDYINDGNTQGLVSLYDAVDGPGNDNGFAVYLAVECTDSAWPANCSLLVARRCSRNASSGTKPP